MRELELIEVKRIVDAALAEHGNMKVNLETEWQLFTDGIEVCVDKQVDGKVFMVKGFMDRITKKEN